MSSRRLPGDHSPEFCAASPFGRCRRSGDEELLGRRFQRDHPLSGGEISEPRTDPGRTQAARREGIWFETRFTDTILPACGAKMFFNRGRTALHRKAGRPGRGRCRGAKRTAPNPRLCGNGGARGRRLSGQRRAHPGRLAVASPFVNLRPLEPRARHRAASAQDGCLRRADPGRGRASRRWIERKLLSSNGRPRPPHKKRRVRGQGRGAFRRDQASVNCRPILDVIVAMFGTLGSAFRIALLGARPAPGSAKPTSGLPLLLEGVRRSPDPGSDEAARAIAALLARLCDVGSCLASGPGCCWVCWPDGCCWVCGPPAVAGVGLVERRARRSGLAESGLSGSAGRMAACWPNCLRSGLGSPLLAILAFRMTRYNTT